MLALVKLNDAFEVVVELLSIFDVHDGLSKFILVLPVLFFAQLVMKPGTFPSQTHVQLDVSPVCEVKHLFEMRNFISRFFILYQQIELRKASLTISNNDFVYAFFIFNLLLLEYLTGHA